ncbi:MAG: tripartite tricarboxylate transporter TctB family protein [Candidatus Nanopelagicaceae bacterium]|nr:tripartite tricarboxylate transporter TctB family protein [Candidatus Nanopelagicaceae bacterium]
MSPKLTRVFGKVDQAGKGELVFAGSLLLLGIFVAWDTFRMDIPQGNTVVSPRTFPYIVAAFVFLVSVGLFIDILRGKSGVPEGDEPGDPFKRPDYKTMAIVMCAIGGYVVLLEKAGFIIAALTSFWGVAYAFGSRKYLKDFAISAVFSVIVFFAFTRGLKITLPTGIFEGILGK